MQTYTDPATGRRYAVDPATGRSYWVDEQQGPQAQPGQQPSHQGYQPQPDHQLQPEYQPRPDYQRQPEYQPQPEYQLQPEYRGQPDHRSYDQPQPMAALRPGLDGHPAVLSPSAPARPGKRRSVPGWIWGVGGLVIGLAIGSLLGGSDPTTTTVAAPVPSASGKAASSPAPKAAAGAAKFGTPVRDGKFEFTVTGVKTATKVGNEFLSKAAQGQFLIYSITVRNIGDQAQLFDASSQKLHDAAGKEYSADAEAGIYLGDAGNALLEQVNPGNSVRGQVVFDVPKGTTAATLELHDSPFSGGVDVIPAK